MPLRFLAGLAGVIGTALTLAAPASAGQFCVHHAGCSGPANNFATIQGALGHAAAVSGPDTILVGPGTYDGPFSDDSGNVVTLVGSGSATVLDDPGTGDVRTTLTISEPQSRFSAFNVIVPVTTTNGAGVISSGTVDRVTVGPPAESTASTGVLGGGTFDHMTISGVPIGVRLGGRLLRSRVSASVTAVDSTVGVVENSLLRLTQAGGSGIATGTNGNGTVEARQVTLIGPNDADSRGVNVASGTGVAEPPTSATLDGVVIRGFGHSLSAVAGTFSCGMFMICSNPATITVSYSDWDSSHDVGNTTANDTITSGSGDIHVLPRFRNPGAGDYRLQHTSPLIDASDPSAPLPGDSTLDLNGAPRKVDGNHDGAAVVDIGAFELQPFFGLKTLVTLKLGASKIPAAGPLPVVVSNLNSFPVNGSVTGQTAKKIPVAKHKKRHVTLKPQPFSLAGHRSVTLSFGLPKSIQKQLKKKGKLTFDLLARVHDPDGDVRTVPATVTVHLKR